MKRKISTWPLKQSWSLKIHVNWTHMSSCFLVYGPWLPVYLSSPRFWAVRLCTVAIIHRCLPCKGVIVWYGFKVITATCWCQHKAKVESAGGFRLIMPLGPIILSVTQVSPSLTCAWNISAPKSRVVGVWRLCNHQLKKKKKTWCWILVCPILAEMGIVILCSFSA